MEDIFAEKLLPTSNIRATIHNKFPTEKVSLVDQSIEKIEPSIIYPESTDLGSKSPIIFNVHDAAGYYLDVGGIQLEVICSVERPDGNRLGAGESIYLTNNLLSSLFPIRKVFINDVCVETQYAGHHIGRLKHLLYTNYATAVNRGQSRGLFAIGPNKVASPISAQIVAANDDRVQFSKQANIHLKGYLEMDTAGINQWLVDLCTYRLVLEQAPDNLIINYANNNIGYRVRIQGLRLHCPRVKPTPAGFLSTSKLLQKSPLEYIFSRHLVHSELLAAGQSMLTITRPFNSNIPHLLYIFMVKQSADNGNYLEDPFYYQTNNLTNYRIMVDGHLLENTDINLQNGAVLPYVNSLAAHNNSENFIPFKNYTKGSFVLICRTNHSNSPNQLSYTRKGNLSIHLKLTENVDSNMLVYVIGKCHSTYEINSDRNVVTNYSH